MTATAHPSHRPLASAPHGALPLLPPSRVDDQGAAQPALELRRVAVIEDSAIHFEVLEQHLRAHYPGLQAVAWIRDATAILDRLAAFGPDLVITDHHLPGYDIVTTLTLLRQRWPSLPVLVMSGRVGEESVVQLLKAGANDFLPKARLERLPLVIDRELAEAQAKQAQTRLQRQLELHERQMAELSRELHDNLGQVLALLKLHLGTAAQPDTAPPRRAAEIDAALPLVDLALSRLREVCGDLWPSELRDFGLGPALAGVCTAAARAAGITVSFDEAGQPCRLASSSLLGLFRVGQQAVTNALRHADAATVQLQLRWSETAVALQVSDDGIGFDVQVPGLPSQHGLRSMRERMELLGGSFQVASHAGQGTTVQAQLPVPARDGA